MRCSGIVGKADPGTVCMHYGPEGTASGGEAGAAAPWCFFYRCPCSVMGGGCNVGYEARGSRQGTPVRS